ncbi:hypothetical protein BHE90_001576 [Fusarium euwallaceae]|uniref:Uncharacterized protein n=2 Tax=Fusarium solani species complex TaxID=232080 RepID=A0A3M2S643_9HYPO|nr:hypothetical protein CDV36_007277 [Fusarium kuroshium]RTE83830.1 hypothetical protein BHE90_001576 [Fusarium euwallaceae]
MIETLPWPRKDAKPGVHVAEIVRDLVENCRGLFAPPYSSQLDIEVAELSSRGTETFSFDSEGGLREHLSIYHNTAAQETPNDDDSENEDEDIKASILDEGFAGFDSDITFDTSGTLVSFESCYMLNVDHGLRQFINYLDEEITKVFDRVIMSGVEPTKLNEFDSVEQTSKDLKTLQYLSDQARRLIASIELNMETIRCLQKEFLGLGAISLPESPHRPSVEMLSGVLEKAQQEHKFSLRNASSVLDRAKATSEQLRDTAALRNSEITKMNSEVANMNTLAIAQLAEQSSRETHVVKTLTVLALVFVPASFVADFLQMGFISMEQEDPMRWAATADLKIYATLAIPLIGVTMLIYASVEMMQRKGK